MHLVAWNMSDGTVAIHKAGCQHRPGSSRRSHASQQDQVEFGKVDWASQYEFCYDYWNNGILEEHEAENGVGSFDVFQEMDFAPCTKGLPERADLVPMEDTEMTENKAKASKPAGAPRGKATGGSPAKSAPLGKAPGEVPAPTAHLKASGKSLDGKCRCGCGEKVGKGSTFRQGHDARWISKIAAQVTEGKVTKDTALGHVKEVSDALHGKLVKALAAAQSKADKAAQAARAKETESK